MAGLEVAALGLVAAALWALAFLVWVGARERRGKRIEAKAGVEPLRSEQLAAAWLDRYVSGECEVEEFEAGVERALRGQTDAMRDEWFRMAHERRRQSFATVDELLKSVYKGPVRE